MNSVHVSRFPRFRVLISAKRSEKACRCTVMYRLFLYHGTFSSFSSLASVLLLRYFLEFLVVIVHALYSFSCLSWSWNHPTCHQIFLSNWKWWQKCFEDGLRINGTTEDADKLVFLRAFVGPDYFTLLKSSARFADALRTLDRLFLKPMRVLFVHHHLLRASSKTTNPSYNFWKADTISWRLRMLQFDLPSTKRLSSTRRFIIRTQNFLGWKTSMPKSVAAYRLHVLSEHLVTFRSAESSTVAAVKTFS